MINWDIYYQLIVMDLLEVIIIFLSTQSKKGEVAAFCIWKEYKQKTYIYKAED